MKKIWSKIKNKFSIYFITSFKIRKKAKISRKEKVLKYTTLILLPVLAIASGTILGIREYNKNNNKIDNEVIINTNVVKRKIFLVSNDNYTVPLTINMEERSSLQQEIVDVFNLLKQSTKVKSDYVNGYINDNTKIISFNLENQLLELNLTEDFLTTEFNPINVIEGLTLTFLQFDEIDGIKLLVDGKEINSYNQIPLPTTLDYNFGINQEVCSIKDMLGKEKVVVFGERKYDEENSYLIPVTLYVDKGESDNITFVNGINRSFSPSTNLKKLELYQGIEKTQEASEEFVLSVNNLSLEDEGYVNKELFDIVNMSLEMMNIDQLVSFTLEEETIQVSGVYQLDNYQVSSIVLNEYKL